MRFAVKFILILFCFLILVNCRKKYAENTLKLGLWRTPEKMQIMRGFVTSYKVNGADSLDTWKKYNGLCDIKNIELNSGDEDDRTKLSCVCPFFKFKYTWVDNFNGLIIDFNKNTFGIINYKNFFVENGLKWEILRLEKKGKGSKVTDYVLKIKTEKDGNTIEIQFN